MASIEYFLVSESFAVDQTTNQASVFNIVEEVRPPGFPSIVPQLASVCSFNMSEQDMGQEFTAILRVHSPGQPDVDHPAQFTATHRRQRVFTRMIGLPVHAAGSLVFEMLLNGVHHASHTITVAPAEAVGA